MEPVLISHTVTRRYGHLSLVLPLSRRRQSLYAFGSFGSLPFFFLDPDPMLAGKLFRVFNGAPAGAPALFK